MPSLQWKAIEITNKILKRFLHVELRRERAASLRLYKEGAAVTYADALALSSAVDGGRSTFHIPVERCVWGYGWRYVADEHPYLRFYDNPKSLEAFYARYCPVTIEEAFTVSGSTSGGRISAPLLEPALREIWPAEPCGDTWLDEAHGSPHSGPVSPQLLALEQKRLTAIRTSIQSKGWQPERFDGHIRGFFLTRGQEYLFKITGGQHRAAALAHLGWKTLPVTFQPDYPRIVGDWSFSDEGQADAKAHDALRNLGYYFDEGLRTERKRFLDGLAGN